MSPEDLKFCKLEDEYSHKLILEAILDETPLGPDTVEIQVYKPKRHDDYTPAELSIQAQRHIGIGEAKKLVAALQEAIAVAEALDNDTWRKP